MNITNYMEYAKQKIYWIDKYPKINNVYQILYQILAVELIWCALVLINYFKPINIDDFFIKLEFRQISDEIIKYLSNFTAFEILQTLLSTNGIQFLITFFAVLIFSAYTFNFILRNALWLYENEGIQAKYIQFILAIPMFMVIFIIFPFVFYLNNTGGRDFELITIFIVVGILIFYKIFSIVINDLRVDYTFLESYYQYTKSNENPNKFIFNQEVKPTLIIKICSFVQKNFRTIQMFIFDIMIIVLIISIFYEMNIITIIFIGSSLVTIYFLFCIIYTIAYGASYKFTFYLNNGEIIRGVFLYINKDSYLLISSSKGISVSKDNVVKFIRIF